MRETERINIVISNIDFY